jgi:iron complex outermembrane recepter protein
MRVQSQGRPHLLVTAVAIGCFAAMFRGDPVNAAEADENAGPVLQEILVTAQKRTENVQDVPIAVTALSGAQLAMQGIQNSQDIQFAVPAFNFANNADFGQPYLRGIGSDVPGPGDEPSVATFVDGIYIEDPHSLVIRLMGVDRVEVLAGPQGTLYGRNASGGAINIYTLTPSQQTEAAASVTYGNFNRTDVDAHVSGGVSDTLALGIYAAYTNRDTILDFVNRPSDQPTYDESSGVRLKGVWTPAQGVKVTGSFEYLQDKTADVAIANTQPNGLGYAFGAPVIIGDYLVSENNPQYAWAKSYLGILRAELDVGFADFVSLSGYRNLSDFGIFDFDATSAPLFEADVNDFSRQSSEELQLLSHPDSKINWITGLYFLHEDGGFAPTRTSSPILFASLPYTYTAGFTPERTISYAVFAQATAPLSFVSDNLKLTAGLRYTHDKKEDLGATAALTDANGANVLPSVSYPYAQVENSKVTPKVTLDYMTDVGLVYLTYAEGYKSAIFNVSTPSDRTPTQPESLDDIEGGFKFNFFDKRWLFDVAVYHYKVKNLQVQILGPAANQLVYNAASAHAIGADITTQFVATNDLRLNLSTSIEHGKYDSFPNAPYFSIGPGGNTEVAGYNATGNDMQRTPHFVGTAGFDYHIPAPMPGRFDLNTSLYYNSGFSWDPSGQLKEPSYKILNSSVTYTFPGDRWKARAFCTNLTNSFHYEYHAVDGLGTYATPGNPRMYGLTVSVQF